ncbi:hypothetical protein CRV15_28780 (plasmid) [Streptomyces clavuligerus]|nr:hypothetical protein CRV15_28780 [Streptomyces clavuligerus]
MISAGNGHPAGMRLGEVERLRGELSEFVADAFAVTTPGGVATFPNLGTARPGPGASSPQEG